jgi:EAL domain-containing protein (putative c-di-GMP-specific phosphodiesterase class I)
VDVTSVLVTEGIEQAAERGTLIELGCDLLQGYVFGKPAKSVLLA